MTTTMTNMTTFYFKRQGLFWTAGADHKMLSKLSKLSLNQFGR